MWWFWSTIPQRGVWTRWQWQSAAILASSQGSAAAFTPCVCVCVSVEWRVNLWLGSVPGERLQKWPFFIIYCISLFHLISSGSIHCSSDRSSPPPCIVLFRGLVQHHSRVIRAAPVLLPVYWHEQSWPGAPTHPHLPHVPPNHTSSNLTHTHTLYAFFSPFLPVSAFLYLLMRDIPNPSGCHGSAHMRSILSCIFI